MDVAMEMRLQHYVAYGNDALELKMIRKEEDIENEDIVFYPEMSHQVFGDSETIFGYKDLTVKLYYSAGCLETYLGMTYSAKLPKGIFEGVEPDDVLSNISSKLAPNVHDNLDSFVKALSKDIGWRPAGDLIHSFDHEVEREYRDFVIYKADMTCKGFKEYHQRLQTFALWYIDAANFIDVDDEGWHYFNLYEKYKSPSGETLYATVGFAHVYQYYAYPQHTRPRIAQILILPTFARMGLGAELLKSIYRHYIGRDDVKDITVEDPAVEFQRVRDYVDAENCMTLPSFRRENLIGNFNKEMANEAQQKFKINRRQARRVYEILRLKITDTSNEEEYREYRLNVKRRLNIPFKRGSQDVRKLESALKDMDRKGPLPMLSNEQRMQALDKEYRELETEYKKVIQRLEIKSEE